jgi:hypothetical protein
VKSGNAWERPEESETDSSTVLQAAREALALVECLLCLMVSLVHGRLLNCYFNLKQDSLLAYDVTTATP